MCVLFCCSFVYFLGIRLNQNSRRECHRARNFAVNLLLCTTRMRSQFSGPGRASGVVVIQKNKQTRLNNVEGATKEGNATEIVQGYCHSTWHPRSTPCCSLGPGWAHADHPWTFSTGVVARQGYDANCGDITGSTARWDYNQQCWHPGGQDISKLVLQPAQCQTQGTSVWNMDHNSTIRDHAHWHCGTRTRLRSHGHGFGPGMGYRKVVCGASGKPQIANAGQSIV